MEREPAEQFAGDARLLETLQRLLGIQSPELKPALDEVSTLINEVLRAEKVDVFLYEAESDVVSAPMSGDDVPSGAELETWHVFDAGGPTLRLKVRFRDGAEQTDWRDGPGLSAALELAESEAWHAYDREPGTDPGEYAIFHLKRMPRRQHQERRGTT